MLIVFELKRPATLKALKSPGIEAISELPGFNLPKKLGWLLHNEEDVPKLLVRV